MGEEEEELGAERVGRGSVRQSIAISCFNCETQAGSRINVELRVLQTVTPRGCCTPTMRVLLSFSTPPKPAELMA